MGYIKGISEMVEKSGIAEWRTFWFLPLIAALGYATSVIHLYSIGPFIGPMQHEFGWSRAQISSGMAIAAFVGAAFCIPVGMLIDKVGPRRVALVGVVMIVASFALLGTATGQAGNWIILWVFVAIGSLGVQTTVWTSAVASRFERSRGMALAVTLSGASVAATIFPLAASWLIQTYGWRTAFVGLGLAWGALVLPIVFFGFRGARDAQDRPDPDPGAKASAAHVLSGVTFKEGLRQPALYKLLAAAALLAFAIVGALVHFVPILTGLGTQPLQAAATASLIGVFSIIGRLGTGFLLDRLSAHRVGAVACLFPVLASGLLLLHGDHPLGQSVAAIMIGLALGAEVDVVAYLASRHFGLRSFGALYGALVMALGLGTAFGPLAAGAMFDHYGGYTEFLVMSVVLMLTSAASFLSLGPTPTSHTH